jgi:hypothetical protein
MGRKAFTEPQCLYKGAIIFFTFPYSLVFLLTHFSVSNLDVSADTASFVTAFGCHTFPYN